MPCLRIIVKDAGFEPRLLPQKSCGLAMSHHISNNEPLHIQQWAITSSAMSHYISNNEPPLQTMSHHISNNQPPHIQQWATTSPTMSHHISNIEPPHLQQWATTYPTMSHHISNNEPPYLQQWATTSLFNACINLHFWFESHRKMYVGLLLRPFRPKPGNRSQARKAVWTGCRRIQILSENFWHLADGEVVVGPAVFR